MAKKHAKRLVKQGNGNVSKTARNLSENGRLEIFAEHGRFPANAGGLEPSLCDLNFQYQKQISEGLNHR